ncbi:T9SS type A sorting domain-containing protein [Flammeovirga kamogawensis]|uniref:T9SS type A sorting domain-containing protein n=1 Tax=Flammeovirga kamogawensis TaxID=373891 RepID=A0ABX8H4B0_9BACT|nr:T9SS type A sorting domain-containing protein [Flammeovirga kamogawensis]MBB6461712.1 hypothetical protein [Flammeovirga kamogawensis]QWG10631.1 T9SS type A sorting domain-containing protein [Flammeovirga kamogawensis]TRX63736.1 hypothetical protein EO216_25315 [Flammeovirga kamogawensis]
MLRLVLNNGVKGPYISFSVPASCSSGSGSGPGGIENGGGFIPHFSSSRVIGNNLLEDFTYHIYPNPVKGKLNIEGNSNFMNNIDEIKIYDINGALIKTYEFIQYESNSFVLNTIFYMKRISYII